MRPVRLSRWAYSSRSPSTFRVFRLTRCTRVQATHWNEPIGVIIAGHLIGGPSLHVLAGAWTAIEECPRHRAKLAQTKGKAPTRRAAGAKLATSISVRENPKEHSRTPYSGRMFNGSRARSSAVEVASFRLQHQLYEFEELIADEAVPSDSQSRRQGETAYEQSGSRLWESHSPSRREPPSGTQGRKKGVRPPTTLLHQLGPQTCEFGVADRPCFFQPIELFNSRVDVSCPMRSARLGPVAHLRRRRRSGRRLRRERQASD